MITYELRDYQDSAVEACTNFAKYRTGNGYVVAPGGSGKSVKIAKLAERLAPLGRVVILARNEKLLRQNRDKLSLEFRERAGIYCAGIGEKDASRDITIASIQSISRAKNIEPFAFALVDECDEIHPNVESKTEYWNFFRAVGNPRIIGFTATPYRAQSGVIQWGEEIINIPIAPLIERGFLVRPTNKVGVTLDLSDVKVALGEYAPGELEAIYTDPALLATSVAKIKQYSAERSSVAVFTQSLRHSDMICAELERNGMPCVSVSGETDKDELDYILTEFSERRIKYLVNCMLLTVGVDLPCLDMVAILRATKSKRLFEQMMYRGTRPYPDKQNFLVLDMGNNLTTHGPLGSPWKGKGAKEQGGPPSKICPSCEEYVTPITARECSDCGYAFPEPERPKIDHARGADTNSETVYCPNASADDIVRYAVEAVRYKAHKTKKGDPCIRVDYHCGYGRYGTLSDYLNAWNAHPFPKELALKFMKERGVDMAPPIDGYSVDDLLFHCQRLRVPTHIIVDHREEFPKIIRYEWEEQARPLELEGDSIPW